MDFKESVSEGIKNPFLYPTIFHEDWWLNAATNGEYRVAEVFKNGNVVGRLPYWPSRRFGLSWCKMPPITPFLGPAVDTGEIKSVARIETARREITRSLIQQLPSSHFLKVKCHRDVPDVIAFQEQKFRTGVQFSHEIHPTQEVELWNNLRGTRRQQISKARSELEVMPIFDHECFISFYEQNLRERKAVNAIDNSALHRIIHESITRQNGQILIAKDSRNLIQAAIFCVSDSKSTYYLMSSRSMGAPHGVISLLIWEAIKISSNKNIIFDFAGVGTKGSIIVYSDFGGVTVPRYTATKVSLPVSFAYTINEYCGNGEYFY